MGQPNDYVWGFSEPEKPAINPQNAEAKTYVWGETELPTLGDGRASERAAIKNGKVKIPSSVVSTGTADYVLNESKRGIVDLLSIPGLGVDLVAGGYNMLSDLVGGPERPIEDAFGSSKGIQETLYDWMDVKDLEAPDKETERLGTVARYAAPSIITGPAFAAASGLSKLSRVKAFLSELYIGIGTGITATLGGKIAEDRGYAKETGELVGSLFGAGGTLATTKVIDKSVDLVTGGASDAARETAGLAIAQKKLKKEFENFPESNKNIEDFKDLSDNIPGYKGTLAQAANNPGLASIEHNFSTNDSEYFSKLLNINEKSAQAIADKLDVTIPKSKRFVAEIPATAYRKLSKKLKAQAALVDAKMDKIGEMFLKNPTAKIGNRLRILRKERFKIANAIKNKNYEDTYALADDINLQEDMSGIYDVAKDIMQKANFQEGQVPRVFREILLKYAPPESVIKLPSGVAPFKQAVYAPFREFHSLIRRASEDKFASKDPTTIRYINQLQEVIKTRSNTYKRESVYGEVAKSLQKADKYFVNEYKEVFLKGVGGRIGQSTKMQDSIADEDIIRKIVLDRVGSIKKFKAIYGESRGAQNLLENGIMDVFRSVAKDPITEQITEKGINTFNKNYGDVLDELPNLKRALGSVETATKKLDLRKTALDTRRRLLDKGRLRKMSGILDTPKLLHDALEDPKKLMVLRRDAKNIPKGKEMLARSYADLLLKEQDPLAAYMRNDKLLAPVFNALGERHAKDLRRIFKATSGNKQFAPEKLAAKKPNADTFKEKIGTSLPSIGTRWRDSQARGVSPAYILSDLGGRYLYTVKKQSMDRLLKKALLEPDLSKDLSLFLEKQAFTKNDIRTLKKHIASLGALSYQRYPEDEESEE